MRIYLIYGIIFLFSVFCNLALAQDSTKATFFGFKFNEFTLQTESAEYDTLIDNFHIYNDIYKYSLSNTFLGNYGHAFMPNLFFKRQDSEFSFLNPYLLYTFHNDNDMYFKTNRRFTKIEYISNFTKAIPSQGLDIMHNQNLNPFLNLGLRYKLHSSNGHYLHHNTRDNALNIFASFDKRKFKAYLSTSYNKLKLNNNGGIIGDTSIMTARPENISVRRSNANNTFINKNLKFTGEYNFVKRDSADTSDSFFKIGYQLKIADYSRVFDDENLSFYENIYNDSLTTHDSTHYTTYNNLVYFKLQDKFFNSGFVLAPGLNNKIENYYSGKNFDTMMMSNGLDIRLYQNQQKEWNWKARLNYYLTGYKSGDIMAKVNADKIIKGNDSLRFRINGSFSRQRPYLTESFYYGNNFIYDTLFQKKDRTFLSFEFINKKRYLKAGLNASVIDNFIYYNDSLRISQYTSTFNVFTAFVEKQFNFKWFTSYNRVYYQYSDNDKVISVPDLCVHTSNYAYFKLFKVLKIQLGFDVFYNTEFNSYSFSPALNSFYLNDVNKTGNYPFIDVFANIKLKRARFFLKYEHVNQHFTGYNYLLANHYPAYGSALKFGISWNFYD